MKTIIKDYISEIEINRSRFITLLYKVKNLDEVKDKLLDIRDLYKDATHYCFAYIINDYKKSSDDGEPGGTAGVPIMEVLLKNDLNYVLCVVVRYFGGIKLGAGGLVRAYSKATTSVLEISTLVELVDGYNIEMTIGYDEQKRLDYLLKNYMVSKTFSDSVNYLFDLPKDKIDILCNYKYKVLKEVQIEKDIS